jgi:putative ABC transport system permease protein
MLAKRPGFTLVAVIALALGIGANTAIFSVVNAVLINPLPYPNSERLMSLYLAHPGGRDRGGLSVADFLGVRDGAESFESVSGAFVSRNGFNLSSNDSPERVTGVAVTADFFGTFNVTPALGRTFEAGDDQPGRPQTAVVSYAFWQKHLDGDTAAPGRSILIEGQQVTVVGVLPAEFQFPGGIPSEVYLNLTLNPPRFRAPFFIQTFARLKPGVSEAQGEQDLNRVIGQIEQQYPTSATDISFNLVPLKESIVGDARLPLMIILAAVVLVLLIASANVANLLLARSAAREKEMAIRMALGANRGRIIRQLLTESLLLAAIGGVAGLLLALWGVDLLVALGPRVPRLQDVGLDGRVLAFSSLIALLSGVLFGLAPAIQSSRSALNESLKEGGRTGMEAPGRRGVRSALVVVEIALALVLLLGAGLLVRSFIELQQVPAGVDGEKVLTFQVNVPRATYGEDAQINGFFKQLLERINSLPGVESSAVSMSLPPHLLVMTNPYTPEGRTVAPGESPPAAEQLLISAAYFDALRIPIINGRTFTEADGPDAPPVIIINRTMADKVFPGENPLGKRMQTGQPCPTCSWFTVIGVVGDVKYSGLDASPAPTMYTHYFQDPFWRSMYVVVRTSVEPMGLIGQMRQEVQSIDKDIPIASVRTLDELLVESVAQPRFRTLLVSIFAGVALVLAAVGIYGVMSYSVTERRHEIGIRMALGATSSDVMRMVVGHGMRLALIGVAIGVAGAFALTRLLANLLFGVTTTDPVTFIVLPLVLAGVALAATYVPARRATRVDPMIALRHE